MGQSSEANPQFQEVLRRLIDAYAPDRIYLFGSRARGDARPDSDYDLLLVVPDSASPERQRSGMAYEKLWGTATPVDVKVCTREWFESRLHIPASLPAMVVREGKLIHVA